MSFQRRLESLIYNIERLKDIDKDHDLRHDDALSHSGISRNLIATTTKRSKDIDKDHSLRHDDALSHSGADRNPLGHSSAGWNLFMKCRFTIE